MTLKWYAQLATPWTLIFTPSETKIKCCYDTSNGTECSELEPEWRIRDPRCPELPHSVGQEAGPSGYVSFSIEVKSIHQGYYNAHIGKEDRLGGCYILVTYQNYAQSYLTVWDRKQDHDLEDIPGFQLRLPPQRKHLMWSLVTMRRRRRRPARQ